MKWVWSQSGSLQMYFFLLVLPFFFSFLWLNKSIQLSILIFWMCYIHATGNKHQYFDPVGFFPENKTLIQGRLSKSKTLFYNWRSSNTNFESFFVQSWKLLYKTSSWSDIFSCNIGVCNGNADRPIIMEALAGTTIIVYQIGVLLKFNTRYQKMLMSVLIKAGLKIPFNLHDSNY